MSTIVHLRGEHRRAAKSVPAFSLRHKLFRLAWSVAWLLLARWTPPQLHRWRVFLLNRFGADVDPSAHVYPSARIWFPPNLVMHAHTTLAPGVICYCMDRITLEEGALVSQFAHLCTGDHDIHHPGFALVTRPIHLHARTWIAAGAFVGPGVTVGEGAVLGAGGVTVTDLAPWTVYAGNPALAVNRRNAGGAS
jgi:putative colanic acid biosynthesis acetyltransferase WcaF